jgi:site-specific DNA recombinase
LKAQLGKLQRGMERLIDSYSEGVIDKEQFMPRLSRTKSRIAELEARIHANAEGADGRQELQFLVDYFQKLSVHLGPGLDGADWNRRREIVRSLVERIEIRPTGIVIVFRLPPGIAVPNKNRVMVTLLRA